jgi:hemoglobin-like flavoprotein
LFYDHLSVSALAFFDDLAEQNKKLIVMLAAAVNNLDRIDKGIPTVKALGKRHASYGVTAEHYEPVGIALLWIPEQGLGADLTPPVKAAWTETYTVLAGAMRGASAPR